MNDLLIDKSVIKNYAQISEMMNADATLYHHIRHAQDVDIATVLGNEFFTDLVANHNATDAYKLLMNGGSYSFDNRTYSFNGLGAAIACFAYSYYVISSNAISTPFGMQSKSNQNYGEAITDKTAQAIASTKRNQGLQYLNDCLLFLNRQSDLYPLWQNGHCNTAENMPTSVRITKIKRY